MKDRYSTHLNECPKCNSYLVYSEVVKSPIPDDYISIIEYRCEECYYKW
jgi:C4-type Zn-finger protein